MERKTILLVEDDPQIRVVVSDQVELMGMELVSAADGESGLKQALEGSHELVVLDVNLPKLGGIEVCRRLKAEKPWLPVIILSARGSELDRVLGLQLGADDYMVKPFSVAELGARIQARLRTRQMPGPTVVSNDTFSIGPFEVRPASRQLFKAGTEIQLTALEFDVFMMLASKPGVVVTREAMVSTLWGVSPDIYDTSPTPVMTRLRKKVEDDPANPRALLTVRAVGYRFATAEELQQP